MAGGEQVWLPVLGGQLAIGHRPKVKALRLLHAAGATHLLTLLSEREGAVELMAAAKAAGMGTIWLPLESGDPPAAERHAEIAACFAEVDQALKSGGRIYVHCSAGIHRTGMVTHAFLRWLGLSRSEALEALARMRPLTAEGVGTLRLEWGDSFAR